MQVDFYQLGGTPPEQVIASLAEKVLEGIIGLAACLSGEIALYLRQGNYEAAKASAEWFGRTFGPNGFWLEVQDHGIAEEKIVADGMLRIAAELGLPVVATNDAHYLKKEDAEAHDVLLAIGTGKDLDDPKRFRFYGQESYVKSEKEMASLFGNHADVLSETARVALPIFRDVVISIRAASRCCSTPT